MYFLGLVASQRELFQVGRDLNAQTGNLSPLVAAGPVLPDADRPADPPGQLHRRAAAHAAEPAEPEDPLSPLNPATTQEMI